MLVDDDPFGSAVIARPAPAPAAPVIPMRGGKPVTVTLPSPPSANRYWRSRVIQPKAGPAIVSTYVSTEAKQFKESAGWLLKAAGIRQPFAGRVQVDLQLYPHRPLDWKKRLKADPLYWADTVQRIDADNALKVTLDSLKDIAFGDDRAVWKASVEVMEPDGRDACVVVTITPLVKSNPQEGLL
ncbi:MAG: RusA family crossover junction endodeoxyribonuclease [Pseudomonadota bacterium]